MSQDAADIPYATLEVPTCNWGVDDDAVKSTNDEEYMNSDFPKKFASSPPSGKVPSL